MKKIASKKVMSIALALVLLVGIFATFTASADPSASFSIGLDKTTAKAGDKVTVSVKLNCADIIGIDARIGFDKNVFEVAKDSKNRLEIIPGTAFRWTAGYDVAGAEGVTPEEIAIIAGSANSEDTEGDDEVLVTIIFNVLADAPAGKTNFTWKGEKSVVAETDDGDVQIGTSATWSGAEITIGDDVPVTTTPVTTEPTTTPVVVVPVTGLKINEGKDGKLELAQFASEKLTVGYEPATTTQKDVEWKSDKEDVVSVDANGNIKALKEGTAVITVTSKDNADVKASIEVTVKYEEPKQEDFKVKVPASVKDGKVVVGDKIQLDVDFGGSVDTSKIVWSSDNEDVATVDANGLVTFLKAGTVTITASYTFTNADGDEVTLTDTFVFTSEVAVEPTTEATTDGTGTGTGTGTSDMTNVMLLVILAAAAFGTTAVVVKRRVKS